MGHICGSHHINATHDVCVQESWPSKDAQYTSMTDDFKLQTVHSTISDQLHQLKDQGILSQGHQLQVSQMIGRNLRQVHALAGQCDSGVHTGISSQ